MNRHATTLKQTLAIALLGVAACGKEPPTAPDPGPPLPISAGERTALGRVVDDAVAWLIPALEDQAAADALREALAGVTLQLDEGGQGAFDQSMERARAVLARYDGGGASTLGAAQRLEGAPGGGSDVVLMAFVRLTLDRVAAVARGQQPAPEAEP